MDEWISSQSSSGAYSDSITCVHAGVGSWDEAAEAAKMPSVLKVQLLKEDRGKDIDGMGVTNAAAVVTRVTVLPEGSQVRDPPTSSH